MADLVDSVQIGLRLDIRIANLTSGGTEMISAIGLSRLIIATSITAIAMTAYASEVAPSAAQSNRAGASTGWPAAMTAPRGATISSEGYATILGAPPTSPVTAVPVASIPATTDESASNTVAYK